MTFTNTVIIVIIPVHVYSKLQYWLASIVLCIPTFSLHKVPDTSDHFVGLLMVSMEIEDRLPRPTVILSTGIPLPFSLKSLSAISGRASTLHNVHKWSRALHGSVLLFVYDSYCGFCRSHHSTRLVVRSNFFFLFFLARRGGGRRCVCVYMYPLPVPNAGYATVRNTPHRT